MNDCAMMQSGEGKKMHLAPPPYQKEDFSSIPPLVYDPLTPITSLKTLVLHQARRKEIQEKAAQAAQAAILAMATPDPEALRQKEEALRQREAELDLRFQALEASERRIAELESNLIALERQIILEGQEAIDALREGGGATKQRQDVNPAPPAIGDFFSSLASEGSRASSPTRPFFSGVIYGSGLKAHFIRLGHGRLD